MESTPRHASLMLGQVISDARAGLTAAIAATLVQASPDLLRELLGTFINLSGGAFPHSPAPRTALSRTFWMRPLIYSGRRYWCGLS